MKARSAGTSRVIRISSLSNPYSSKMRTSNRVYVGNLDWKVSWQDLKDHMKSVGRVVRADILSDASGRSKGCGIVEFSTVDEAQRAIHNLTDTEILGRRIFVREDREVDKQSAKPIEEDPRNRSLVVENVPHSFEWQELKDLFKPVGNVLRADIFAQGESRYGLVEFRSSADAFRALSHANELISDDMILRVISSGEDIESLKGLTSKKLYVGELAWSVSWQDLKDHFKQIGEVLRADVATEEGGRRSKGFGFVEFASAHDAARAVSQLNGSNLKGREIYVREYKVDR